MAEQLSSFTSEPQSYPPQDPAMAIVDREVLDGVMRRDMLLEMMYARIEYTLAEYGTVDHTALRGWGLIAMAKMAYEDKYPGLRQ